MTLTPGVYPTAPGTLASVVTTLKLSEPRYNAPLPFPAGVTVQRETLSVTDYLHLFRAIGEDWLWVSRLLLSEDALAQIIHHPDVETHVLRRDGQPIGLIELDFRRAKAMLSFFGVIPSEIGTGLGTPMMALAQSTAFAKGINSLHLTTCTLDTPKAIPFYHKHGFETVSRSIEVIADPRLTGVIAEGAGAMHTPLPEPQT